jgi:hypothetical protein
MHALAGCPILNESNAHHRYGLNLDWFDFMDEVQYARSHDKDFYKKEYYYQPNFNLKHVIEDKAEVDVMRQGVRFDSRLKLQALDGTAVGLRWKQQVRQKRRPKSLGRHGSPTPP